MLDTKDLPSLLPAVKKIARQAGEQILQVYGTNFTARQKDDGSPLTEADTASEEVIVAALQQLTPGIPIVGEENISGDRNIDPDKPPAPCPIGQRRPA